jgi:hypothetical protein
MAKRKQPKIAATKTAAQIANSDRLKEGHEKAKKLRAADVVKGIIKPYPYYVAKVFKK